jgi:formate dehydrogenase subunit gamma
MQDRALKNPPGTAEFPGEASGRRCPVEWRDRQPRRILRFRKTERHVHWALAIPFLVCWVTALILVVVYNPDPQRPFRDALSWIHRISGVGLFVLPLIAVARTSGDLRIHFNNILQAWTWTFDDLKWMGMVGLAAVNKNVKLPEQGKFNAAEKLNFMTLLGTYPLYIGTGIIIWATNGAFLSWIVHFSMAVIATPLILGHIYMATINPSSRVGLRGMITGFVDRQWAKHHYAKWFRENFEGVEPHAKTQATDVPTPRAPIASRPSPRRPRADTLYEVLTGTLDRADACEELGVESNELSRLIGQFVQTGSHVLGEGRQHRLLLGQPREMPGSETTDP